ncbi:hypothetical protein ACFYO7_20730 [Nocardia salmonicida]|uniref:hypothetical protein n=1 Tax=Nocardia salmonicida TaxID=53431 RepID=UPI003684B98D
MVLHDSAQLAFAAALLTRREVAHWARQPVQVVVGLVFPVMLLLMFSYLIGGGRGIDGDVKDYLVPGWDAASPTCCSRRSGWP